MKEFFSSPFGGLVIGITGSLIASAVYEKISPQPRLVLLYEIRGVEPQNIYKATLFDGIVSNMLCFLFLWLIPLLAVLLPPIYTAFQENPASLSSHTLKMGGLSEFIYDKDIISIPEMLIKSFLIPATVFLPFLILRDFLNRLFMHRFIYELFKPRFDDRYLLKANEFLSFILSLIIAFVIYNYS